MNELAEIELPQENYAAVLQRIRFNPGIKDRFVSALRSGDYVQTQRTMRRGTEYCCLGVLCHLHRQETQMLLWTLEEDHGIAYSYSKHFAAPPPVVWNWALMPLEMADKEDVKKMLMRLNDHYSWSFKKIADLLERFAQEGEPDGCV